MSEETPDVSTEVVLIPQPHGGALRPRGKRGNAGGGRPKDLVREKLAKIANGKGMAFLTKLMRGEVEVQLVGRCQKCGEVGEPDAGWVENLLDQIRASVDQRLRGLDTALKYGVGTQQAVEHSGPAGGPIELRANDVRERFASRVSGIATRIGEAADPQGLLGSGTSST